ncbi:MAG: alpha-N-arabinofuranosidase [Candidatus Marinimicrobia bacterium]|nr:alpha-N-arabinofuranosidase [Candidatus Neomarinimicrobiota bacterium]MCF7880241.1 alpha-N-arabinofuranosidase [Candidatus Neomarinimicrobiota bacterium]
MPHRLASGGAIILSVVLLLLGPHSLEAADASNKMVINADLGEKTISKHIYGHFAEHLGRCIYGGIWVGEDSPIPNTNGIRNDVVKALRGIDIPNLRWPGGCFADTYHWKDGIGPKEERPTIVNVHWGGVTENNHFGTHEFLELCEQLDTEPLICANMGSGTVREMAEWVEYVNFDGKSPMADLRRANGRDDPWKVKYWGIGNEMWGCGGDMTAKQYADEFRQYASFVEDYGDIDVVKIGSGPNSTDYEWTETLMKETTSGWRPSMDAMDLHYYTRTRGGFQMLGDMMIIDRSGPELSRSATEFGEQEWFVTLNQALRIDEIIENHSTIMDRYDPQKQVGLYVGEWGTWHEVEPGTNPGFLYQQNTLRDALVAGVSLNIFNEHADRVTMANIAQTVNVLQAMILTDEEKMVLTPTYHVFEMYKVHQEATLLPLDMETGTYSLETDSEEEQGRGFWGRMGAGQNSVPTLNASASRNADGKVHITVCNLNPNESADLECDLRGMSAKKVSGRVLTASDMNAHNTFDNPDVVKPEKFDNVKLNKGMLTATLPAMSVVVLEVQ